MQLELRIVDARGIMGGFLW